MSAIIIHTEDPDAFNAYHTPALEKEEARYNLLLGLMPQPSSDPNFKTRRWTLGEPGACAIQTAPERGIVLGDVTEVQCHALAELVAGSTFVGVLGQDDSAHWFAARARQLGVRLGEPSPLRIHALTSPPLYPRSIGNARRATLDDLEMLFSWTRAFTLEAIPSDPLATREQIAKSLPETCTLFWEVDGRPVAMATSSRSTRNGAGIGPVYTHPEFRGRGYAGSVTATLAEHIFASGKSIVYLYTDLTNPFSNRCYAKIGFTPVCDSWHYVGG
jgi:predicted GNAT family acetyltransferase